MHIWTTVLQTKWTARIKHSHLQKLDRNHKNTPINLNNLKLLSSQMFQTFHSNTFSSVELLQTVHKMTTDDKGSLENISQDASCLIEQQM